MDSIPPEILEQIFWHLIPRAIGTTLKSILSHKNKKTMERRRRDLHSVMLCCSLFYHAARPAFYHTVVCVDHELEIVRIQRLIQTCIDRPETASYVQEIYLGESECNDCSCYDCATGPFNLESFQAAVKKINVTPQLRRDIQTGLSEGTHFAMIALLWGLCPNLNVIHATQWFIDSSLLTRLAKESITQMAAEGARPLQRLQEFGARHSSFEHHIDLESIFPYFRLPSLEVFLGEAIFWHERSEDLLSGFRSNLRHINISESKVSPAAWDLLMATCPDLRELDMKIGDTYTGTYEPNPGDMGDVLRRYGSRIRRLSIQDCNNPIYASTQDRCGKVLGCLTTMRELHTLHVTWSSLLGLAPFDATKSSKIRTDPGYLEATLPCSLKELRIMLALEDKTYVQFLDRQLLALMESEQFGELRLIGLRRTEPFSVQCPPSWRSRVNEEVIYKYLAKGSQKETLLWREG